MITKKSKESWQPTPFKIYHGLMKSGESFTQQYIVLCGLSKFGHKGMTAASKELDQLHHRKCFAQVDVSKRIKLAHVTVRSTLLEIRM